MEAVGHKRQKIGNFNYTLTPTVLQNLADLELCLKTKYGLCLIGPPSSGKTTLIQILAEQNGHELISLFIDSSIDSKTLLGTYLCTEVPGEFTWVPGLLTQAALDGAWLILEQFDKMPEDIYCLFSHLLETNTLHIPNRGQIIKPANGFRLFATAEKMPSQYNLSNWLTHHIIPLNESDLFDLAPLRISKSDLLRDLLIKCFGAMKEIKGNELVNRDWFKLCDRVNYHVKNIYGDREMNNIITESLRELIFLEAMGVLLGTRDKAQAIECLAGCLSIDKEHLKAFYENRTIRLTLTEDSIQIGKAPGLPTSNKPNSINFACTPYTLRLLENLCTGIASSESLLLVGETGNGKTTIVQSLAKLLGAKLYVHNLSQVSDPSDIVGGFKPIAVSTLLSPLVSDYYDLIPIILDKPNFSQLFNKLRKSFTQQKWHKVIKYMQISYTEIQTLLQKGTISLSAEIMQKLTKLTEETKSTENKLKASHFAFQFVEGSLVKALKEGSWILLEEINLAENEMLERLHSVLEGRGITLVEKAESKEIKPHVNFRLFGCMNPGKQVGKKELPSSLRAKFTEIWVEEMERFEDIKEVVVWYLEGRADRGIMDKIVNFYLETRKMCREGMLEDGRGKIPQYSMRTLCRALRYVQEFGPLYGVQISLFNALRIFFETMLSPQSRIEFLKIVKNLDPPPTRMPKSPSSAHIELFGFWHEKGPLPEFNDPNFILTPSVREYLTQLSRAIIFKNNAILLEGPTSSGKTSMVKYLAGLTGHEFLRINNHQHTDIEEYIGSYVSDERGRLIFLEGPLVKAVKEGYFVVLDELNLAPSEVLEALNRLLDDNRELFITETQTTIKPHPHFRLFATQNPTGYAGRKELSKAFRNRFVEMFIPELPDSELIQILEKRGKLAPSYAQVLINVMRELQRHRQQTRAFLGRQGFITIRDLLKIANREPIGYEQLGHFTFAVLGERLRNEEEKEFVKSVIEKNCKKIKIDMPKFYDEYTKSESFLMDVERLDETIGVARGLRKIAWNSHMKRLYTLVDMATKCNEPVLLVGETGCGKTTICQALASMRNTELKCINCHQYTETSDFIGSLQPIRDRTTLNENEQEGGHKLFEWADGPLVEAYNFGKFLLIDEISLADDSVLERLNSVLEIDRKLLVPEKGGECSLEMAAAEGFQLFATMNPGGDYGKKELSPALRNRFTEMWVRVGIEEVNEVLITILDAEKTTFLIRFIEWYNSFARIPLSLRDAIAWCDFIKNSSLEFSVSFWEGLSMILLDYSDDANKAKCMKFIIEELQIPEPKIEYNVTATPQLFGISPFFIETNSLSLLSNYSFNAPNIKKSLYRLLRAIQLNKPIMLEGPPGVGKTSIVESLGKVTGHKVTRINLSEETDLIDLLGCDIPIGERFEWCDGVLLSAIKAGDWVILDELNLCPQPVIEGLNALLDHRATVYIPEINKEVQCPISFRIFAAQNPVAHGGGRKGLPKSFLNRFTKIYISELTKEDYIRIISDIYPNLANIDKIVEFNEKVKTQIQGPWEFNLRDMLRWCQGASIELLYFYRTKTPEHREKIQEIYYEVFGCHLVISPVPYYRVNPDYVEIGKCKIPNLKPNTNLAFIPSQMNILEQVLFAIEKRWPILLVGDHSVGKTSICRLASVLMNKNLYEYTLSPTTDSSELLGSFEQNENGKFEWYESTLAKALRNGDWILLKNANLCPASVLDRINSLMEPNGSLLINERGQVNGESYILRAHPDFCMFITFNPKLGEVSRALRNRCIEISMLEHYNYMDVLRITGSHFVTKESFARLIKNGFGEILKWEELSRSIENKEKSYSLLFGDSIEDEMEVEERLMFEKLSNILKLPIESYLNEDLKFLEKWNDHNEAKACFFTNSCYFDCNERANQVKNGSLAEYFQNIWNEYSNKGISIGYYTPLLNPICPITQYIPYENQVHHALMLNLSIFNLSWKVDINLKQQVDLFLYHIARDDFTKHKIISKSIIPDEISLSYEKPLLSKELISSWKQRVRTSIKACPIPLEKFPAVLSSNFVKKLMSNINYSEEFPKRRVVVVSGEEFIDQEIGLIMDKETCQAEQLFYIEEIKDLYEQVLLRALSRMVDSSSLTDLDVIQFLNNEYIPTSLLKPLWILRYKVGLPFSIREIALPILQAPIVPETDFLKIYRDSKETTIFNATKHWFLIRTLLKWPQVKSSLAIPNSYLELVFNELTNKIEGSELELYFTKNESYKAVGLGLWLYKLYKGLICDPSELYKGLSIDYQQMQQEMAQRVEIRQDYSAFRYGYNFDIPIITFYSQSIQQLSQKINKAEQNIIPRPANSADIISYITKLPSYERLSQLVSHNLTSLETEGTRYLFDLLQSFLSTLISYQTIFPDLCSPLLEALLLIQYGLKSLSIIPSPEFIYPFTFSSMPISLQSSLIKGHLFYDSSFLPEFLRLILDLTEIKESEEPKKLKIVKTTELETVHTIGEQTREENIREYEEIEKREIEKLFPKYRDERAWIPVEMKKRKEIIEAWKDWEFACGTRDNELKKRFLGLINPEIAGVFLSKPLEIHLKNLCNEFEYTPEKEAYNFYLDPNPKEAMAAYTPLVKLISKLADFLKLFPDHEILKETQYLAYKVLSRPLFSTPLMQLVSGFDNVLKLAHDWEDYTGSEYSLKSELHEIYDLLKRWRESELQNWEGLLEAKKSEMIGQDAKLWARLFRVLYVEKVRGKELYEALEMYIRSSSLGCFENRLRVLKLFEDKVDADQVPSLHHIYAFYTQFQEHFNKTIDFYLEPIKNKLKEIVKIARFNVSNYHAWRETAFRAHRQLNTLIKKYKDVLVLKFEDEILRKIRQDYSESILEKPIQVLETAEPDNVFEELSLRIFERIETIKNIENEQGIKYRSLIDLLNNLKELGFSQFYHSKDTEKLSFSEQPVINYYPEELKEVIGKGEEYYYRCIDKLTILHSLMGINDIIKLEDKEKCLGYAIFIMYSLIEARRALASSLETYKAYAKLNNEEMKVVCQINEVVKEAVLENLQLEIDQDTGFKISCFKVSGTMNDLSLCKTALSQLSEIPKYSEIASSLSAILPEPRSIPKYLEKSEIPDTYVEDLTSYPLPAICSYYKSLGKLLYILISIFSSLFSKGFCGSEEEEEAGEESGEQLVEGTGLGEGKGNKDIGEELIDEEQFQELQNQEESEQKDVDKEGGMDVREEFEGEERSAEGSEGEDIEGNAEGNEKLMEEEQEARKAEGEVRESANPEMTKESEMEAGLQPQDREGEAEDFEMAPPESGSEENMDMDIDAKEEDLINVDKRNEDYESSQQDSGEESMQEDSEAEQNQTNEPNLNEAEMEGKETKEIEGSSGEEEEKRLEEYKDREFTDYDKEAYGVDNQAANTDKMKGNENKGEQNSKDKGSYTDVISQMKGEWNSQQQQQQSETGQNPETEIEATVNDVETVNMPDDMSIDRPESSNIYTFDENFNDVTSAPSLKNNPEQEAGKQVQPKKSERKERPREEVKSESFKTFDSTKRDEQRNVIPKIDMINFNEGNVGRKGTHRTGGEEVPMSIDNSLLDPLEELEKLRNQVNMEAFEKGLAEWENYERETSYIAQELCEQLRIILEPTKAKGLQGDYKTGKRINMKKVIAYIASQFRKDKIWLRRTRPTAREYQVLLAIDDSFSMKQHGLGDIAKKGLSILAQALHKLEVGELGVAGIRNGMNLLHDFGRPFSSDEGGFIMSQLDFEYGRDVGSDTAYPRFMQQCYDYLEKCGNQNMQLVIIISDGRLNKNKVRPWVRKNEGIFFLFVIVDNQESSIMDMQSVVFEKKDGKNLVKKTSYLEDFPFEYYVVVQNPGLLVTILLDVIKQWFELMKE
ncbi:unnamed protein product [Blepharisma stoltei]|uniref:Midasin n=1 Tax=Blepharisma stoltei TaxID=1481888 RepID=A0AAU9J7F0_9CILI|nr:unnamed protein product [Blepharisma stoltei]